MSDLSLYLLAVFFFSVGIITGKRLRIFGTSRYINGKPHSADFEFKYFCPPILQGDFGNFCRLVLGFGWIPLLIWGLIKLHFFTTIGWFIFIPIALGIITPLLKQFDDQFLEWYFPVFCFIIASIGLTSLLLYMFFIRL